MSLLGTITGPPNTRRAILLNKKKKVQDIYCQGDKVQGALIKEVQRGKIILNVNGKEEMLVPETPKTTPGAAAIPNFSSPIQPADMGQVPPPEVPVESGLEQPMPIVTPEAPEVADPNLPNINKRPDTNNPPDANNPPNTNNNQEKP